MSRAQDLVLTKFRRWLERQPRSATFVQCLSDECPLAAYLQRNGELNVSVGTDRYSVGKTHGIKLPAWALRFRKAFDNSVEPNVRRRDGTLRVLLTSAYRRA